MNLFFDTETTGKVDFKASADAEHQPRLVQLAAILTDLQGKEISSINLIVKPKGYTIPNEASEIHGITTEIADVFGTAYSLISSIFDSLLDKAKLVIAHNINFDAKIMSRGAPSRALRLLRDRFCTMESMTDVCKIKSTYGYKWPSLQEAYKHCFGKEFDGAHDALADVRACKDIYFWIKNGPPKTVESDPINSAAKGHVENEAYSDTDLMPFGKHINLKLQDVPASYFHWLWSNKPISNRRLEAYIKANISALKKEYPNGIW